MIAKHHAKLLKDCYGDGLNALCILRNNTKVGCIDQQRTKRFNTKQKNSGMRQSFVYARWTST